MSKGNTSSSVVLKYLSETQTWFKLLSTADTACSNWKLGMNSAFASTAA